MARIEGDALGIDAVGKEYLREELQPEVQRGQDDHGTLHPSQIPTQARGRCLAVESEEAQRCPQGGVHGGPIFPEAGDCLYREMSAWLSSLKPSPASTLDAHS